jgi:hypothetical protein
VVTAIAGRRVAAAGAVAATATGVRAVKAAGAAATVVPVGTVRRAAAKAATPTTFPRSSRTTKVQQA